jgi:hypothetical protein
MRASLTFKENIVLERHLDQLSSDLELEPYSKTKDDEGFYTFNLTDDMCLRMKELLPGLIVRAQIAPCPDKKRTSFYLPYEGQFPWALNRGFGYRARQG